MMKCLSLLASTAMMIGGAASAAPRVASPVPATGEARSCVQLQNIRQTKVRDDRTIDFVMRGGKVFRNSLPYACPQLGFERAFTYSTSITQLCSVDIITVIRQGGGLFRGASCGLGKFVPIAPEKKQTASR